MHFAHISDLHLCQDPAGTPSVNDDAVALAGRLVRDIAACRDMLDFVVVSGDLTEDAAPQSFRIFEDLVRDLDLPLFVVPGNHDGPAGFEAYKAHSGRLSQADISGRTVDLGDVRLFGINTCVEGKTTGAIPADSLEQLARELDRDDASQLVIVMHHPPFGLGQREFDEISVLERSDIFCEVLQAATVRPVILCGHVHRPYVVTRHGVPCFIGGSPARCFAADPPFGETSVRPSHEPYSYFVHCLDGRGNHVVTPRWVGTS